MATRLKPILFLVLLFAWGAPGRGALNPALPPSGNFNLANWELQEPTVNGVLTGTNGSVDQASAAQLTAGFTNAYFFTGPDGAMTFWAPDDGAHTTSSEHPRSELRELLNPNDDSVNWTMNGYHILTGQCKVLQVPSDTHKVCIGQIHEPNYLSDGVTPGAGNEQMIMFDYGNSKIYVNINLDGNQSSSISQTMISGSAVQTNALINYFLSVSNGLLTIAVNNVTNSWNLYSGTNYQGHIAQNWTPASSNTVYFKAGDYNQTTNACGCSTDGAKVAFYSVTRLHTAAITNQPVGVIAGPGSNVTFTVGAVSTGTLTYQWQLNGANVSAGATNTVLSLTNISAANAGNYTVIVTDVTPGFNSVTSSVATLTGSFPPVITSQPAGQAVPAGSNATFSVSANSLTPIAYNWWFNVTNQLHSATNSALVITNVQPGGGTGNYTVVLSNASGVITSAPAALMIALPSLPVVASTNTVLDAQWADGTRTNTALPAESAWFANKGASLTALTGALTGVPDPTVTLTWWTYFTTNAPVPVNLDVSDMLRLTLRFTVGGSVPGNSNRGLRVGLYSSSGGTRTLVDGANPGGAGCTGYMLSMNFGSTIGLSSPLQLLERTNVADVNLISTTGDYGVLGQGGPVVGTGAFSNGLPYTLVLTAKRNSGSVDLTATFSSTNGWSESLAATDPSATNAAFDTFVFRPAVQAQIATNFTFTELKVELVATNNHAPVAGALAFVTPQNNPLVLPVSTLIAADSDPDGDSIAVTAVSGVSTNGGLVSLVGGNVTYTPPASFAGSDAFSYTLTDSRGASTTGNVFITVAPSLRFDGVAVSNELLQLNFTGLAGSNYVLQAKTNLTDPLWQNIATNATDGTGAGGFPGVGTMNPAQRFFRIAPQ